MNFEQKEHYGIQDLLHIVEILRDPINGCPWDRVQTHHSIRMNFLEETYEVLEAIDKEDSNLLCEELGDVLLQVALHSRIEEQIGKFGFDDVCDGICRKLIGRHPHIFGDPALQNTDKTVLDSWDEIKNKEKGRLSVQADLESVPVTLPALMKAAKTQKRASRYGFAACDLPQAETNMNAAAQAFEKNANEQTMGELLFCVVQAARAAQIDPELALEKAVKQFSEDVIAREQAAEQRERNLQ